MKRRRFLQAVGILGAATCLPRSVWARPSVCRNQAMNIAFCRTYGGIYLDPAVKLVRVAADRTVVTVKELADALRHLTVPCGGGCDCKMPSWEHVSAGGNSALVLRDGWRVAFDAADIPPCSVEDPAFCWVKEGRVDSPCPGAERAIIWHHAWTPGSIACTPVEAR